MQTHPRTGSRETYCIAHLLHPDRGGSRLQATQGGGAGRGAGSQAHRNHHRCLEAEHGW